jgi:hypothetical protein
MNDRLDTPPLNTNLIGLATDNLELGTNYLEFKGDVSDEQLIQIFKSLSYVQGSTLFWIGDFLNTIEMKKGEAYAKAYALSDYTPGTLWVAKSVCKKLPRHLRCNLSYTHHREALIESKGNMPVAVDFLRKAEAAGLTVKEMRQSIRRALADSLPSQETNEINVIDPEMLRIQDALFTIRRFLENTNSSTFALRKEFVRAELETLLEWAQAVCQ